MNKLILNLLAILLILFVGCQKKSDTASSLKTGDGLEKHALLASLPKDANGFLIWDLEAPGYQKYLTSPWVGDGTNLIEKLSDTDQQAAELKSLTDFSISLKNQIHSQISALVLYSTVHNSTSADKSEASVNFILRAKSTATRSDFLSALSTELSAKNMALSSATEINENAKKFDLGEGVTVFYSVLGDTDIIAGTQAAALKSSIQAYGQTKESENPLLGSPLFIAGRQNIGTPPGEYALGFWDLDKIQGELKNLITEGDTADIPFSSVAISQSMEQGPLFNLALQLKAGHEKAEKVRLALKNIGNLSSSQTLPGSSVATIAFNGKAIAALVPHFTEEIPSHASNELSAERLLGVGAISLALQAAAPGNLFPGLSIKIETTRANELYDDLKNTLADLVAGQLGAQMAWQTKQISEQDSDYILTPLGVGLYLTKSDNALYVSTSELGLSDSLNAVSGKAPAIDKTIPAFIIKDASQDGAIVQLLIRFNEVVKMAKEMSGSLSMFTGGEELFAKEDLDKLEKLGLFSLVVKANDSSIGISTRYGMETPAN